MSIQELEAEALKLAPDDQARLLNKLARALDAREESELTNDELEKRWSDFLAGKEAGIGSSELRARASEIRPRLDLPADPKKGPAPW
jgi:hypothetical protein